MISKPNATAFALIFFAAGGAYGAIPQPDGIVFGTVRVDGASVDNGRDFVVLARVEGFEAPIAVYRMGDLPAARDRRNQRASAGKCVINPTYARLLS